MWLRQPQYPAPLDYSNPLTRGLQFCFDGRSRCDAVSGRLLTPVSPSFTKDGVAAVVTNSGNVPQLNDRKFISGSGLTFFVRLRHGTFAEFETIFGRGNWGAGTATFFQVGGGASGLFITSGTSYAKVTVIPVAGLHSLGVTADGTSATGYVDGREGLTASWTLEIDTGPNTWLVGAGTTDFLEEFAPGDYLFAAAWNRPLAALEMAELHANPWRIYAQGAQARLFAETAAPAPVYGTHGQWDKTLLLDGWYGEYAGIKGWYAVDFLTPAAPGGMVLKAWNGSAWVTGALKRWNGASWVAATLKRWNGSSWV